MGKRTFVNDEDDLKYTKEAYNMGSKVGVRFGVTKNLGDYNSLVVNFWEEDEPADGESTDEASERIYRKVEARVEKVLDEYAE